MAETQINEKVEVIFKRGSEIEFDFENCEIVNIQDIEKRVFGKNNPLYKVAKVFESIDELRYLCIYDKEIERTITFAKNGIERNKKTGLTDEEERELFNLKSNQIHDLVVEDFEHNELYVRCEFVFWSNVNQSPQYINVNSKFMSFHDEIKDLVAEIMKKDTLVVIEVVDKYEPFRESIAINMVGIEMKGNEVTLPETLLKPILKRYPFKKYYVILKFYSHFSDFQAFKEINCKWELEQTDD